MSDHPTELADTERFEIRGYLGSGTSGEVYRAFDRKRQTLVALKTLHQTDGSAIYRFKREFRALADVHHPNLVQLYELLQLEERLCFTMELVEGEDFVRHVRGRSDDPEAPPHLPDEARLRHALRQLAAGLMALHEAGKLHCDIKPSNLLVDTNGRLVLLDFGLVKEWAGEQLYETVDEDILGTPAYMSPEQAAGQPVARASDWYAVGVVLYEALSGRLPFAGTFLQVLRDKQKQDPPPVSSLVPGVGADLSALAMALLARDPTARPDGSRVLQVSGAAAVPTGPIPAVTGGGREREAAFVGRESHLRALDDAFALAAAGHSVVGLVSGSSGMGKSALADRFLRRTRQRVAEAVILSGRCYELESVPYKALDALVDALSRFLRQLPDHEAQVLLPTNAHTLARLFPALRRVRALAEAQRRASPIPDSRELRRRAFTALRELLGRVAARQPLVLYIDDLQWGDLDSGALLVELLRPPDPPPLLLVACYRREERDSSPLLGVLLDSELVSAGTTVREILVDEMPEAEARSLALVRLEASSASAQALAAAIARESGGSPFFIDELVRYARFESDFDAHRGDDVVPETTPALHRRMTLDNLVQARLERLPPAAGRLLATVAVAGRPVDLEVARRTAGLEHDLPAILGVLRSASLLRMRRAREREEVETYHDRIRQTLVRQLPAAQLRQLHGELATTIAEHGDGDPETLAFHFAAAGETSRAAALAAEAGVLAAEALAFDRSARLFRTALALAGDQTMAWRLQHQLGDALTNAGRGAEAADAYLLAAVGAPSDLALELRRRAAEQQLICGHIDAGLETLRTVLASIGMTLPATPRRTLLDLARSMVRLKLRGLHFEERAVDRVAPDLLVAVDTCWAVSIGLGTVDTIRGMAFAKRQLLLALEAGEPYRVARALAIEAAYSAADGNRSQARTARLVEASMALARRVEQPHARALADLTAGMAAYLEGRWRQACELLDRSEGILRERCTGVTWELDTTVSFQLRALLFRGRLGEIIERLPSALKDQRDKGDLYAETNLRSRVAWVALLAADRPEEAEEAARTSLAQWSHRGFHIQHYWRLTGLVETALYRGDRRGAWAAMAAEWPLMKRSLLLRIQLTRTEARQIRSRAALAAAVHEPTAARRLRATAEKEVRRIEREGLRWANPLAQLLRAGLASLDGDGDRADALLATAAAGFDDADMELYAAVSRLRRGQLRGADGEALREDASRWIVAQGVHNVARLADVLAPGRWPG